MREITRLTGRRPALARLLLLVFVLSSLPGRPHPVYAQASPSACAGLEQVKSWSGSMSFAHSDAKRWDRTDVSGSTTVLREWDMRSVISATATFTTMASRIDPGSIRYDGPGRGSGSADIGFYHEMTSSTPGWPPVVNYPLGQPYAITGSGPAEGGLTVIVEPASCTAQIRVALNITGLTTDYGAPTSISPEVKLTKLPIVRDKGRFVVAGTETALEFYAVGQIPPHDHWISSVARGVGYYYHDVLGQMVIARVPITFNFSAEGPAPATATIDSVALEHGDYPSGAWVAVPPEGTIDGNRVRVTVRLRNPDDQPVEALLDLAETVANADISSCPTSVRIPPTGDGPPFAVSCVWDTGGFAWAAGATPAAERVVRATLSPVGGTASTREAPLRVRPRPLFLIPTVTRSDMEYRAVRDRLRSSVRADWEILAVPGLATGGDDGFQPSLSVYQNGRALHAYIEQQRAALDAWRVDLVGHGLGGLTARWYVHEHMGVLGEDQPVVRNLIMLGTPNLGTPCAAIYLLVNRYLDVPNLQAWRDQLPLFLRRFNAEVSDRGVTPWEIAGDGEERLDCLFDEGGDGQPDPAPEPSDGLVPLSSAQAHTSGGQRVDARHWLLMTDPEALRYMVRMVAAPPHLGAEADRGRALPAEDHQPGAAAAQVAPAGPQSAAAPVSAVLSADVPPGAVVERTFEVPAAAQIGVSLIGVKGLRASLLSPTGQVVATAAYSDTASGLLRADRPVAGTWTLRLSNEGAATRRALGAVQILGGSLLVTARAGLTAPDGAAALTVAVSDRGAPVTGATVTVDADGSQVVALRDDGRSGDGAAGDGIYGGRVSVGADFATATVRVIGGGGSRLVPVVFGGAGEMIFLPKLSAGRPYRVAEGGSV